MKRVPSGIPGLDGLIEGGFLEACTYLVTGMAGAGKSIFGLEYLCHGAQNGEPGVYVSFEEPVEKVRMFMNRFGWELESLEREKKLALVDASMANMFDKAAVMIEGKFDLSGLYRIIEGTVKSINARRIFLDPVSALLMHFNGNATIRLELFSIKSMLEDLGCTVIMSAEMITENGPISRFGVEEFVSDGVLILHMYRVGDSIMRALEIRKMRGVQHSESLCLYRITAKGIELYPNVKVFETK